MHLPSAAQAAWLKQDERFSSPTTVRGARTAYESSIGRGCGVCHARLLRGPPADTQDQAGERQFVGPELVRETVASIDDLKLVKVLNPNVEPTSFAAKITDNVLL